MQPSPRLPCPNCKSESNTRFPGSDWCVQCVDETLAEQDAIAHDHRIRPQVFRT